MNRNRTITLALWLTATVMSTVATGGFQDGPRGWQDEGGRVSRDEGGSWGQQGEARAYEPRPSAPQQQWQAEVPDAPIPSRVFSARDGTPFHRDDQRGSGYSNGVPGGSAYPRGRNELWDDRNPRNYNRDPGYGRGNNRYGYGYGYDHHNHRWDERWGRRGWDRHQWRRDWYSGWGGNRWRAPSRYSYPRSHGRLSWSVGYRLPRAYYAPSYYIDYRPYNLTRPPYGCSWVRIDSDLVLVDLSTGEVLDALYGFFY